MHRASKRGFTLIEILVALAVFSVLAVIAYQGVARLANAKQVMDADNRKWRELTVALARFDDDFAQVANRPWRDEGGTTQSAVRGAAGALDANGAQLELVRYDGERLTHLGYRLRDGHLELLLWNALDLAPRSSPTALAMLDKVKTFSLRFLDGAGQWQLSWPQGAEAAQLPRGVEVTITLESGETVTRLFALP
ncbi:GspJ family type II secretion system protein [Chitinimonas naiadis]